VDLGWGAGSYGSGAVVAEVEKYCRSYDSGGTAI
jgi:hypothetical protein